MKNANKETVFLKCKIWKKRYEEKYYCCVLNGHPRFAHCCVSIFLMLRRFLISNFALWLIFYEITKTSNKVHWMETLIEAIGMQTANFNCMVHFCFSLAPSLVFNLSAKLNGYEFFFFRILPDRDWLFLQFFGHK